MKRKLIVKESAIHGKGLFAGTAIKKGTVLGVCRTRKTVRDPAYELQLESGPVEVTCRLKYINHNSKPNVAYYDDLTVEALRNIKPGEELVHHYGDDWE